MVRLSMKKQINKLANFIMKEIPGETSQSEGAVDTAIRLLRNVYVAPPDISYKDVTKVADLTINPRTGIDTTTGSGDWSPIIGDKQCKNCGACDCSEKCDHCGNCKKCGKHICGPFYPYPWYVNPTYTIHQPTWTGNDITTWTASQTGVTGTS